MEIFNEDKRIFERRAVQEQFTSHQFEHEHACMRIITWGIFAGIGIPTLLVLIKQAL